MGYKDEVLLKTANGPQMLFDFRNMLVGERLICVKRITALGMMSIGSRLCAGPARTRFRVDYNPSRQQAALNHRGQPKQRRRREAARVCDVVGGANCLAIRLGQSVDKTLLYV